LVEAATKGEQYWRNVEASMLVPSARLKEEKIKDGRRRLCDF